MERPLDDAWRESSDLVGHPLPGGIDPPGTYLWEDGCLARLGDYGGLDVTLAVDHDPSAKPVRRIR